MTELSAPFPYFGGKRRAAPKIWDALGDVGGYVEPFAGSAAVLLARPRFTGRPAAASKPSTTPTAGSSTPGAPYNSRPPMLPSMRPGR
ncbi:adenine-specific DNA methyltransferase [Mycobacteroides abscessus M94]|uniref:DNA adenine methylase n=1 Tax=Mycobacteroides abscessus TaxID=36809 RepID=UPI0002587F37|nr:DNA adenine methylase [Mycobacteroides abscessus]EIC70395.1 adenine-specific DNA methyltransferase [Mycobacteroides abscessus M94]